MTVIKAFWRFVVIMLVLIFVLPLIHFYGVRALQPESFMPERHSLPALAADLEETEKKFAARFKSYLHDFYQNGL
ncbi:MAG: hypothetical protein GX357_04005 [Firmicutes bacterium]|nr:hypothetical protein [Bacillota bacterium]